MNPDEFPERMNCPNLAKAFEALLEKDYITALEHIEQEIRLRSVWVRPLRFDTASGSPIGHLPEDEDAFLSFARSYNHDDEQEALHYSLIYAVWGADMVNTESRILSMARETLDTSIKLSQWESDGS